MKVTILGCGPSIGVPVIGCSCEVCTSDNPKNSRKRTSAFVEVDGKSFLIDTGPDLRNQTIEYDLKHADAVLYTHEHADHAHGIDEMRNFNRRQEMRIPAYGDKRTMELLEKRFAYVFGDVDPRFGWYRAALGSNIIEAGKLFEVEGVEILPFEQTHGRVTSIGYRVGDFAYSTDVNVLDEAAFEALKGVKVWCVDCQSKEKTYTHSHLENTLAWIERVQPERAVLIHMGHDLEYESFKSELPDHIEPAYDGMVIDI